WREFGAFRSPGTALRARAASAADTVGLAAGLGRLIGEISVGELQRALFARLILQDAAVILLDEPFAAIDAQTITALLDQVTRWHREGRTVIAVLHDLDLVRARFPSTRVLARRGDRVSLCGAIADMAVAGRAGERDCRGGTGRVGHQPAGAARCRSGGVLSRCPLARRYPGGVAGQQCRGHARPLWHRAGHRP